jgi:hypothetical protein
MSDERDVDLVRLFASAERPLAGAEFLADLQKRLAQARGLPGIGPLIRANIGLILRGMIAGVGAPFRVRWRRTGLAAVAAAATFAWLVLEES